VAFVTVQGVFFSETTGLTTSISFSLSWRNIARVPPQKLAFDISKVLLTKTLKEWGLNQRTPKY
jgi:hypothetical protein